MGAWEYRLWMAKDEIDGFVQGRQDKHKGLSYSDALNMVRADHRAHLARKAAR